MMERNEGIGQFTEVVGESQMGTIPGEFGGLLQQSENQYVANRDKNGTWRILDQWSSELMHLSPDDEIQDDNPAVTVLSEGVFAALIQAAIRTGIYPQLNQPKNSAELSIEDVQQMAELTAENELLKKANEMLEGQIDGLKLRIQDIENYGKEMAEVAEKQASPVSTEPTLHAMDLIAELANKERQVQSISSLARE